MFIVSSTFIRTAVRTGGAGSDQKFVKINSARPNRAGSLEEWDYKHVTPTGVEIGYSFYD